MNKKMGNMKMKIVKQENEELYGLLTARDIEHLHHTSMGSFIARQSYRFEVINNIGDNLPDDFNYETYQAKAKEWWIENEKECSMYIYGGELEWLMAYNYYTKIKSIKAIKVIDLAETQMVLENEENDGEIKDIDDTNMYCIIINKKYK